MSNFLGIFFLRLCFKAKLQRSRTKRGEKMKKSWKNRNCRKFMYFLFYAIYSNLIFLRISTLLVISVILMDLLYLQIRLTKFFIPIFSKISDEWPPNTNKRNPLASLRGQRVQQELLSQLKSSKDWDSRYSLNYAVTTKKKK